MRLKGSGCLNLACTRPCASCSSSLRRLKPLGQEAEDLRVSSRVAGA
jgi:hypothetical protein